MRARAAVLGLAAVMAASQPSPAVAYSGVGRAALELALGRLPETKQELGQELKEGIERKREAGDQWPELSYQAAILALNRPTGFDVDGPRKDLGQAVVEDPSFKDALQVWIDLVPHEAELIQVEQGLRERLAEMPERAPVKWALARVMHLRENFDGARRMAQAAVEDDPAYRGRSLWLQAVIAGEGEDDEKATERFLEALEAFDGETADLMWRSALLIAEPREVARYETLTAEELPDFFRSLWQRRDVFPVTAANERLGEHFRRIRKARKEYYLRSNGRGYLTTHDVFHRLSPDLDFYSSDVVFDYQERMPDWLNHRGLVYVRHGKPDREVRTSQGARSESWLYYRLTFKPLMFHFVDRLGIGEHVLSINLAQAMVRNAIDDNPELLLLEARDFRDLYGSRAAFHPLFQRIALSRSRYEVEELLLREASMAGTYAREAWLQDTNQLIEKDDLLPFAAYSANFRTTTASPGTIDAFVYYAVPEKELESPGGKLEFAATMVLYDSKWEEQVASADHSFTYERKPGAKPRKEDMLVGAMEFPGLQPARYNFAFQVTERQTGKVGIAKGRLVADYYGPGMVDLSNLLIAEEVKPTGHESIFERNGQRIVPNPARTIKKARKGKIYFEVYDLERGSDGKYHYRVDHTVLQIQQQASVAEKVLGLGMNVAGIFFPYQIFLARAGLFGLDLASAHSAKNLETRVEGRVEEPTRDVVSETLEVDTTKYAPGIYQAYITVKDYVTGSRSTRSIRFAVID